MRPLAGWSVGLLVTLLDFHCVGVFFQTVFSKLYFSELLFPNCIFSGFILPSCISPNCIFPNCIFPKCICFQNVFFQFFFFNKTDKNSLRSKGLPKGPFLHFSFCLCFNAQVGNLSMGWSGYRVNVRLVNIDNMTYFLICFWHMHILSRWGGFVKGLAKPKGWCSIGKHQQFFVHSFFFREALLERKQEKQKLELGN